MPNTIKVKRGKSAALNTSTEKLQAGEILYNLDKNYLTVGAEDNDALTKKPVAAREIVGYTGDTDSKIGTSTTEAYSIKYDTQLKIKDGDNTLLVPKKNGTLATTEDITASASTKLDNTNEDKIALKNNRSLSYTSDATASTVMSRDANGRAKVADGAAAQDIATVGQLNTGLNAKYTKPEGGIPKTDLASSVQTSLGKADTALQSHQTVKLESGTNNGTLKLTVNGTSTDNIAVTNLGSAAFTAASNYAAAAELGNYYTKTESDGRYVKSAADIATSHRVYVCIGNKDGTAPLAETPTAYGVAQYSINRSLQTNNPTEDLDSVNKKYGEDNYYNLQIINFIGDTADLNTLTTVGNYGFGPSTSVHNGPEGYGGGVPTKFIVENLYSSVGIIKQTLISNSKNKSIIYTRTGSKAHIDQYPWIQMADTSYVDNKKVFSVTIYEAGE